MRLICPNCGAQYEVDDDVIPESGRDVQCSNCGHAWFQRPPHLDAELAEELDAPPPDEDAAFEDADEAEGDDDAAPGDVPQPERRSLDPAVANVLREEAEREAEARRAEADGLETQPDLGLDDTGAAASDRSAAARARMARLRGLDDEAEAETPAAAGGAARRELLPDIDEINSSLRASQDREEGTTADEDEPKRRRGGFGTGFLVVILIAAIAAAVYAFAPQIAAQVPQTEPYLVAYVDWVNQMRVQVDAFLGTAMARISELISGLTGGDA